MNYTDLGLGFLVTVGALILYFYEDNKASKEKDNGGMAYSSRVSMYVNIIGMALVGLFMMIRELMKM